MTSQSVADKPIADLISLRGRNAVITGGARGLGLAIARRLAEAGAGIMLGDLNAEAAERAAADIARDFEVAAKGHLLDVTRADSVAALAEGAVADLGTLDIWVNNAGIYPVTPLLDLSDEEWDAVNDVDLRGTFFGCREAAKRMLAAGTRGVIINIESMAAFRGRAGCAHYAAAKHGVNGLTKSLAVELGPSGIRVLAIAPTLAETPGVHERRAAAGADGTIVKALEDKVVATIPLGRTAQPDDIARVALFCASDLAHFVTGTTVFADGGHSAF